MFSKFERTVAFRYLGSRRRESFINVIAGFSLAGIALGVATLIVVMAVMNGFRTELMSKILGINAHVYVYETGNGISDYEKLSDDIRKMPEVTSAFPLVEGQAMVTANGASSGALIKSMSLKDFMNKKLVSGNIKSGSLENFSGINSIIIGTRMAEELGVKVGDYVKLISSQSTQTVLGSIPKHKDFQVVGIFEIGMYEYDNAVAFVPLEAGQLFFRHPGTVSTIEIMLTDPERAQKVAASLFAKTKGQYRINDWRISNAHLFNALVVEKNVMFLILTLIIIVAAFNIISGMIMLVKDKTSDIAILRAMGATRRSVLSIFIICGSSIGFVGTFLGFALGLTFSLNIETIRRWIEKLSGTELFSPEVYYLSQLPAEVKSADVIAVVLMSLILSFLSTIYPAYRAARLSPVEGLKYE